MMQFKQVDDDAYDVRMNLDSMKRIATHMTYIDVDGVDSRNQAIAVGFDTAYKKFSQSDEIVEISEEQ